MDSGAAWAIIIVAFVGGGLNLLFPAKLARLRRRNDPELERRIAVAQETGRMDELGAEVGFFRRWLYRDYFYPRGARLMALPYLFVGVVMLLMLP